MDLPDPGIDHTSPEAPALEGEFFTTEPPEKPIYIHSNTLKMMKYLFLVTGNNKI